MNIPVSQLDDADMQNAPKAMVRAALKARELAAKTQTAIVIMRNGQIVLEYPSRPAKSDPASTSEQK